MQGHSDMIKIEDKQAFLKKNKEGIGILKVR